MNPDDMRLNRLTLLLLGVLTLLRLPLLSLTELVPDEAYYWDWSRRLSLGYYDQGPLIAYLIRITTSIFGTNEFGVRIGALLSSLGAVWACVLLAKRIYSPLAGFLTALFLSLTPLMTVGSLISTYDPPLVFCWAWAILMLHKALFSEDLQTQNRDWMFAGVFTGLGFLSKHTMLLLAPCLLLFLLLSKPHRRWLSRPQPYLAFGLCLLLYSGAFYWNAQNHWWTFRHLLFLAGKTPGTFLKRFGDFLGSQALLLGPVLFLGTLWAGKKNPLPTSPLHQEEERNESALLLAEEKQSRASSSQLFLVCMGLPVFLFFCVMTLKSKVQGNWGPCAWLSLTVLFAGIVSERFSQKAYRRLTWATVSTGLFLTLALLSPGLRKGIGVKIPPDIDLFNTAYGWRDMASRIQGLRDEAKQEGRTVFLAGSGYQYPALMAFYLPDHPETFDLFLHYRLTMYAAHVERLKAHLGEDCLWINDTKAEDADLRQIFTRVEWLAPVPVWRRPYADTPIRTLYIAKCYGYRRYTGIEWAVGG
ncbi:MAG: glycosyltransferase family 39 protein [Chthonomonadaceae bacterium]|nr:glycosyltransferase family 39 protein [Chthonomonadaceae bacterium]